MKRIAIVGANGQVGTEVCLRLREVQGIEAVPVVRNPSGSAFLRLNGMTCRHGRIADTKEARELIASEKPGRFNILISDLGLPDGSGHDLMRDLSRKQDHPIPGIALSGYGMKEDIRESMEAGFARHLTKPVDWQELKGAIDRLAQANAHN